MAIYVCRTCEEGCTLAAGDRIPCKEACPIQDMHMLADWEPVPYTAIIAGKELPLDKSDKKTDK